MFGDTKFLTPTGQVGSWHLMCFWVILWQIVGSQTHYPIRPRELRTSQFKCNSDWKPSNGGPGVAATRGRSVSGRPIIRFSRSVLIRNAS